MLHPYVCAILVGHGVTLVIIGIDGKLTEVFQPNKTPILILSIILKKYF